MPLFNYRARDPQGQLIEETISFDSEPGLREHLRSVNLYVIEVVRPRQSHLRRRVKLQHLVICIRQLRTVLNAGMPLVLGVDAISVQATDPTLREVLRQIARAVSHGASLADSMGEYPWIFPPLLLALVRSGETSGRLPEVLAEACRQLEQQMDIRQRVLSAVSYPLFTLLITGLTVLFMLVFIVPLFGKLYRDMKAPLPAATQALVSGANLLIHYGWIVPLLAVAGGIPLVRYLRTPEGRRRLDGFRLRIPLLGSLFLKSASASLTQSLAGLVESGVALGQALDTAATICGNEVLAEATRTAAQQVAMGRPLSQALGDTRRFPEIVIRMLAVAEQTGSLAPVLREIATAYVVDVDYTMRRIVALIEPMMVVAVSIVVACVLLALYYPIFSMGGAFTSSF